MIFDANLSQNIQLKRLLAGVVDFGIEFGSSLLGAYFGAMMGALVIVLHRVPPAATQKAIWTGMVFGFFFWGITVSWMNRVLIQGMSRASIGKKMMNLEIISTGAPISWEVMMKHWVSATMIGEIKVVSMLETITLAPVYSIHAKPTSAVVAETAESSDKRAA